MRSQLHRHIRNPISIVVIAANRTFLHQTNSSSFHTVLSWYLQKIDKSATQVHRITLENDNCSVHWIQYHDRLVKMLDKLTVRNDVMDLLLTLFLLACSLNEVPGRNDAVQNVFTFSQAFENTPLRNPIALELAALTSDCSHRPFRQENQSFFPYPGLSIWHRGFVHQSKTDSRKNVEESEISM
ncbi:hypothetical protein BASA61_008081 [Batrachochytrium salamandrivorans]|nr:hypothetical protein BASA61_008081 [Batrachochytrium salamandrivorans]